jgi:hypothetical protein
MRYDISIVDGPCPYCDGRRTAHVQKSDLAFCFRCHHNWRTNQTADAQTYAFSEGEVRRLGWYRAAIRAGFYTDRPRQVAR